MDKQAILQIMDGARSDAKANMRAIVEQLFADFVELHGDRVAGDDEAIIAGFATIDQRKVAVIATNKGQELKERLVTHFGSPTPQGYRKALRVMKIAQAMHAPIITLINTPGAYPDADAEKAGQGQVLAQNISEMLQLKVPLLSIIIGEAGSGGALALACSDQVWMLEYSMYTVLSPEGFASIMWKDAKLSHEAAAQMHIEPDFLKEQGVVEQILPETVLENQCQPLQELIIQQLKLFDKTNLNQLLQQRRDRFRRF
ncbi:acetyl-CoA carboxylase carboxyltransferase subunit alpha [Bombilactobacillus thymidiniphilus]|uniref:acetyl-CoA carboxytransferase n=1 Tax=Bombilactobacillus thymidiniphilus TaxID=2923363 RepID=A0ABY4PEP9_9LACO|nr:carboxyltransferase subunit alpha [Bombilactobacillus thymidiniphilus]UQS84221.1 acetyl-CoA carboxylase carboxyl transferase subunit alpha [Bombilactobacillus thymidiniphilus]